MKVGLLSDAHNRHVVRAPIGQNWSQVLALSSMTRGWDFVCRPDPNLPSPFEYRNIQVNFKSRKQADQRLNVSCSMLLCIIILHALSAFWFRIQRGYIVGKVQAAPGCLCNLNLMQNLPKASSLAPAWSDTRSTETCTVISLKLCARAQTGN